MIAVAPRLDQLEIVVAEEPEQRLGALEHARVVVVLEIVGRLAHEPCEVREQPAIDACGHRARAVPGFASTNFDALSSLIASRRPTFICPVSNAVSAPGRPLAAQ